MVVLGHCSLSFIDLDGDSWMVVRVGGEGLGLLGGDGGVPLDQGCHHSSSGLNTKRKRSNIQEQDVTNLTGMISSQNGSLNCCSIGNSFIWIDGLIQFLTVEEIL